MGEIVIKADIRAIRLWLVSVRDDITMSERDRWMAGQTLAKLEKI